MIDVNRRCALVAYPEGTFTNRTLLVGYSMQYCTAVGDADGYAGNRQEANLSMMILQSSFNNRG